jgi:hypothetical protein
MWRMVTESILIMVTQSGNANYVSYGNETEFRNPA